MKEENMPSAESTMQLSLNLDEDAFQQYHRENPLVYQWFKELTLKTIQRGFTRYSAKGIFELIRWHTGVSAKGDSFKVNNNYTPYYARLFEKEFPQHKGFFRKRASKADNN